MLHFHQIIPLKDKIQDRILVTVIALMVCSILVIESSALFLSNLSAHWHNSVTHIATVEVPHNISLKTLSELEKTFKNSSFVDEYNLIDQENIERIIAPWINHDFLENEDISLPTLFTLSLKSASAIERDKLKFSLKALDKNIKLETHQNWLSGAFKRAKTLKILAWVIGLCLSFTLIVSLSILVRTRILLNTDTINLLHVSGASDDYVVKQFLVYISSIALKGVLIGSFLAGILFLLLTQSASSETESIFTFNTMTLTDKLTLYTTPIIILFFMLLTTSLTVSRILKNTI